MGKKKQIPLLCVAAMLAALICIATLVVQLPSPVGGYLNFGDVFLLASAWILGPAYGAAASAIGSVLADLLSGYAVYAPATLVIKAAVAAVAALISHAAKKWGTGRLAFALGAAAGELLMVSGYYLYDVFVMGFGFVGAAPNLLMNAVQGAVGAIFGCLLIHVAARTKVLSEVGGYLLPKTRNRGE